MGDIESYAKGQAIHRPQGWIASHRTKITHLVQGKMEPSEYVTFDVLLHIVGWDPAKPNYGQIDRKFKELQSEWFTFWTPQYVAKVIKRLAEKGYISLEGKCITIPNFAKYQDLKSKKNETTVSKPEDDATENETTVSLNETTVSQNETTVSRDPLQTGTTSQSPEPKQSNQLKPIIPPIVPQERDRFSEFLEVYPWCPAKDEWKARQEWDKLKPDDATVDHILYAITVLRVSPDWQKENGKFIPVPSNFLKGRYFNKVPRQKPIASQPARQYYDADYEHERSALRDNIARLWVSQGRFADRFQAKRELDSWSIEQMREEFRRGTA